MFRLSAAVLPPDSKRQLLSVVVLVSVSRRGRGGGV